jgi:polysaccharide export outer membrane protein
MNISMLSPHAATNLAAPRGSQFQRSLLVAAMIAGLGMLPFLSGCQAPAAAMPAKEDTKPQEVFTLQEGDVVKVAFPGAPNLDSTQTVRRDGKVSMALVGEVQASGRTPTEL